MFQSPLRQAALLRKPSALPIRLAVTSTVVEPATTASRPRQEATPAGCGPAAGPGTLISASVVSRSVISRPSGLSRTILPSPPGRTARNNGTGQPGAITAAGGAQPRPFVQHASPPAAGSARYPGTSQCPAPPGIWH